MISGDAPECVLIPVLIEMPVNRPVEKPIELAMQASIKRGKQHLRTKQMPQNVLKFIVENAGRVNPLGKTG